MRFNDIFRLYAARSLAAHINASPAQVLSALLALLITLPSLAQTTADSLKNTTEIPVLDQMEITGGEQAAPRTGDVVESEHTGGRERISRDRLAQPGTQLGDLIGSASGVQLRQAGGFGSFAAVNIRSASAAQTAVYLDGILLNSGGDNLIDLSTLESLNLSSVDIYKGSSPLQLGQAAIGGAVNLNTLEQEAGNGANIRLGVGSFSTFSAAASFHGQADRWTWLGSLTHLQSDNDFTFLDDNQPLVDDDDTIERRRNNQVERNSLLLKAGYKQSDTQRTDLLLQTTDRDIGVTNLQNTRDNSVTFETIRSQIQISQQIDEWLGWNTRHTLYWHQSDSQFDDSEGSVGLGRQVVDTDIRTLGLKTYWEKFIELGTVGLSLDLRDESLEQFDLIEQDNDDFISNRQTILASSHLVWIDESDTWMLTPSIRWQVSERRGTTVSRGVNAPPTDQDISELNAQVGAQYSLSRSLTLSANAGNYFRQPSFSELFGSSGLINGNPTLRPETGVNTDAGIRYESARLTLDARAFVSRRDDLILISVNAQGIGTPQNVGESQVSGLELSASWHANQHWELQANATFQNPKNLSSFGAISNQTLPGQAERLSFARIQYQPSDIAYWYEWQTSAGRFFDSANALPAADTSLHSIGLAMQHSNWNLSAQVQNISDDTVEDFNGFPKPGRSFHLTLSLDL